MVRALVLTIDLDGPQEYAGIHGVSLVAPCYDPLIMFGGPLRRFVSLCQSVGGPGTLFVVGRDVRGPAADTLRELNAQGFEIASHSMYHDYRLSRCDQASIDSDIAQSLEAIESQVGARPVGFRAPGHHMSPMLLEVLESHGLLYSSSVLPSPPYYGVKAAVLSFYRLTRRSSTSMLGTPRMAFAPRAPYRPGQSPFREGRRRLVELPISVATPARLPVTGASLCLAPAWMRRGLLESLAGQKTVVLNLHSMDLVDPQSDGLPSALTARQPELRTPIIDRRSILESVLLRLATGREVITAGQLARALLAPG